MTFLVALSEDLSNLSASIMKSWSFMAHGIDPIIFLINFMRAALSGRGMCNLF